MKDPNVVVQAMRNHPLNRTVIEEGCRVLAIIARDPGRRSAFIRAGGILEVIVAMKNHIIPTVALHGCVALYFLASNVANIAIILVEL